MQTKNIPGLGTVEFRLSLKAKRLILRFNKAGQPLVVVPRRMPFSLAISQAEKNRQWFLDHQPLPSTKLIEPGQQIGREHQLIFKPAAVSETKSYIRGGQITITHPNQLDFDDKVVQKTAFKAAERALKKQAERYLPSLLHQLATTYGYAYRAVSIRNTATRWGSCSNRGTINLSIWLMQLPDELITYVLCHELAHLKEANHQPAFWSRLAVMVPDYKEKRRKLKQFKPQLML